MNIVKMKRLLVPFWMGFVFIFQRFFWQLEKLQ